MLSDAMLHLNIHHTNIALLTRLIPQLHLFSEATFHVMTGLYVHNHAQEVLVYITSYQLLGAVSCSQNIAGAAGCN